MKNRTRRMKQAATYWPPGEPDGFGGTGFGDPETVRVRWQDKAELFIDSEAREVASSAVVYPEKPLEVGGYLVLGESAETDPQSVGDAKEIRQSGNSPNLRQTEKLNKVWL